MKININFIFNNKRIKKLFIMLAFMIMCFLIHSCEVKAFSLEQVPDFLKDYNSYYMQCANGISRDNGSQALNCNFLGDNATSSSDNMSVFFTGYLNTWTLMTPYVAQFKYNDTIYIYFSRLPLALKCFKGSGNVDSCYFGTYKNGNFNNELSYSVDNWMYKTVATYNGDNINFFNVYEGGQYPQIMSYLNTNDNKYYYYGSNIEIKDLIKANYDVYYVNEDANIYSDYNYINWSSYDEFDDTDNRNWFQKIVDGVVNIPNAISSSVRNIIKAIGDLVSSIVDGIVSIFVPDVDMASDTLTEEYSYLQSRLGFLMYPITLISDFANRFYNIPDTGNAIFTIPNVSFMGVNFISTTSINLLDIVNQEQIFSYIYNIYRIVVSGLIVLWLGKLAYSKFNETIGDDNK